MSDSALTRLGESLKGSLTQRWAGHRPDPARTLSADFRRKRGPAASLFDTVLAALFIGFWLRLLMAFLTVLFWDSHRLLASASPPPGCSSPGVGWHRAAARLRAGSRLFSASLAEIAQRPGSPAPQRMSPELVELALHKQRLQIRSADQRAALIHHAQGFAPVFRGVDKVVDGVRGRATTRLSCPASASSCWSPAPWPCAGSGGLAGLAVSSAGHATSFPEIHPMKPVDLDEIRRVREEADCRATPPVDAAPTRLRLRHHRPPARQEPAGSHRDERRAGAGRPVAAAPAVSPRWPISTPPVTATRCTARCSTGW